MRAVFQHRQIIIDRFPVTAIGRFTWRVSIDAPIGKYLRHLCFVVWPFLAIRDLYQICFHVPPRRSGTIRSDFEKPSRLSGPTLSKLTDNLNDRRSQRLRNHWLVSRIISGLRYIVEDTMTETEERDYANGADGISDIEGKVARVATSKLGNERVSVSREDWALRWSR